MESIVNISKDPLVLDWANIHLPDSEIDNRSLINAILEVFKSRKKVALPDNLPGKDLIPPYVLQEFHNVTNGNYSNKLAPGYIAGFDLWMMGTMDKARRKIAQRFTNNNAVLDVGCGGGKLSAALKNVNVKEVWGLDPSPYLLQNAAKSFPDVMFVQGIAESTGFPNHRFDGITACFVFHEIPPKFADKALVEFNRILKDGGRVFIAEPSQIHQNLRGTSLLKSHGLKGLYFYLFAKWMYEPFVKLWHKKDKKEWFSKHGFELISKEDSVPVCYYEARKTTNLI